MLGHRHRDVLERDCLAPYQSERRSISTMGDSMIDGTLAWGFRLAATCTGGAIAHSS